MANISTGVDLKSLLSEGEDAVRFLMACQQLLEARPRAHGRSGGMPIWPDSS
jgi:hypothetical protein